MARYYRRRYRTIVRAPKKKWASNIKQIGTVTTGDATYQYSVTTLVTNSTESSSPTPVIVKTGNFKIQGDYTYKTTAAASSVGVSLYVVFLPQGVAVTDYTAASTVVKNHPEWIMAWRYLGYNASNTASTQSADGFSFSSRLKRNLNSGDSVALICIATGTTITSVTIEGMAQYWTCAN